MTSPNDKHDKAPASKTAGALDAPLTLPVDQLELVAGGLMPSVLILKPVISGLYRVMQ